MIHGNSNDPVLIKKIALRVWTLRDEIQAVVKQQLVEKGEVCNISDIIKEYDRASETATTSPPQEQIKSEEDLDDSEDAMAAALAEAEAGEEEQTAEEEIKEEEELDDSEDAMAAALAEVNTTEPQNGEVTITQRHPKLNQDQVYAAKTVLAEVGMDRMFFFCSQKFTEGQSIVVEFLVPKRFVINAEVIYCRQFNMKSRIISKVKLPYRVAIDFNFLKEGERTILRQFLKTIEPEIQEPVQVAAKDSDDGGDDFSELDDL